VAVGLLVEVAVGLPVAVAVGVSVGVSVATGVGVGCTVPVGVFVGVCGMGVFVGVDVLDTTSVGVLDGWPVGNDWVGVGSRVEVGAPGTRVCVFVGVTDGVTNSGRRVIIAVGVTPNGVGVASSMVGADPKATMPAQ